MSEEEIEEEFFKFLEVASNICEERGKLYKFNCPICNSQAEAIRSNYNGHLHAQCKKCDLLIME